MPIEIRELHIKATVQNDCGENNNSPSTPTDSQINDIVAQCVEQVISLLKDKQER